MFLSRLLIPTLFVLSLAACGGGGGSSSEPNQAPSVNAGIDQNVDGGQAVSLSADAGDADGTVQSYQWHQTGGSPTVSLDNADTATAGFTAPAVTADTTLTFVVTVTDDQGGSATDSMTITVLAPNQSPIVNAGEDQDVNTGQAVSLSADAGDADGTIQSYQWQQTGGSPTVSLGNADTATAGFTAPEVTADTNLTFSVTVTDDRGGSATDSVTVTVLAPNQLPSVDAGSDLNTYSKATVTLSATASDVDGTIQSYSWQQTAGSPTVTLENADTTEAGFTVPVLTTETTLSFSVTVTDNDGATATDSVDVLISPLVQGFFSYGPVQGLDYATATRSGVTGADGSFLYTDGETITFSVGTVQLGDTVPAKQSMTPLDLIDGATLFTTSGDFRRWYELSNGRDKTAFLRFVNTLSFLQTLDEDDNPDNGIVIPAGIGPRFDGITIDFSQAFSVFQDGVNGNAALRYVAQKAAGDGLLASGRIRNGLLALQQFYSSQGIDYSATIPSREDDYDSGNMSTPWYSYEWGVDADGNINYYKEGSDSYRSTFDDNGNVLSRVTDYGDDGVDDDITTHTYDTRGNLLTTSTDSNGDGTPNRISSYTYDATGNRLSYTLDSDGNGVPNAVYSYTYDSTFHLLTRAYYLGTSTVAESVYSYSYTPEGRLETEEHDDNNDGTVNYRATSTYDASGHLTIASFDNNGDGTVDAVDYYTYDAAGNVLSRGSDSNNDGSVDSTLLTWTYQPLTNLVLTHTYDANADGIPNYANYYTYNADGREIRNESDDNGDGIIDFAAVRTYDDNGDNISDEADYGNDGVVDASETMTYDANGFLSQDDHDYDNDGVVDSRASYTPMAATWNSMMIWLDGAY